MIQSPSAEMIAYHGWGFDRQFWQPWQARLAKHGIPFYGFDRGYFGSPVRPSFTDPYSRKIIFAHSYGLHLCPPQQLRIADLIVVFASFVNFHPVDRRAKRRSQRVLQQMIEQFQLQPKVVLQAFWQNCGLQSYGVQNCGLEQAAIAPDSVNVLCNLPLLLNDLQDLDHSTLCIEFLARRPKILVLQGQQDQIVAPERASELAQALFNNAECHWLEGPHSLPVSQFEDCWTRLRSQLLPEPLSEGDLSRDNEQSGIV